LRLFATFNNNRDGQDEQKKMGQNHGRRRKISRRSGLARRSGTTARFRARLFCVNLRSIKISDLVQVQEQLNADKIGCFAYADLRGSGQTGIMVLIIRVNPAFSA
jgi:hypothetical protein